MNILALLEKIEKGSLSAAQAVKLIDGMYARDLGFARVDLDRHKRCGLPEVIYCPGKTGQNILATRATAGQFKIIRKTHRKASYNNLARTITLTKSRPLEIHARASAVAQRAMADESPPGFVEALRPGEQAPPRRGQVGIVCAGTSDIPVAEEAAVSCQPLFEVL